MKYLLPLMVLLGLNISAHAQSRSVHLIPVMNGEALELGKHYADALSKDTVTVNQLRFYISDLAFYSKQKKVKILAKRHFLIDLEHPESLQIDCSELKKKKVDELRFILGVDSLTTVSGAKGGDLDPTKGMYWSWQSGYIHIKLEGQITNIVSHPFTYHLGGYQGEMNSIQSVNLSVNESDTIPIALDLTSFFHAAGNYPRTEIMRPCLEAVELSSFLAHSFFVLHE